MNCLICYQPLKKKIITCSKCENIFCVPCAEEYLLLSENENMKCPMPTCEYGWDTEFINKNFTKVFWNKYRKHVYTIKVAVEKSLFPSLMDRVAYEKEIDMITEKLNSYKKILNTVNSLLITESSSIVASLSEKRDDVKDNMKILKKRKAYLEKKDLKITNEYNKQCTKDECKGFLSNKGVCALCKTKHCLECGVNDIDEKHECIDEDIKSIKLIKKDTKACPKCYTRIYRTEGCDHMFCVKPGCFTSFYWSTGNVMSESKNTNPLFFQWKRETNQVIERNFADIPYIDSELLRQKLYVIKPTPLQLVEDIHRIMRHNVEVELPVYSINLLQNTKISVDFLKDKIDEDEYKSRLFRSFKKEEKDKKIFDVLTSYTTAHHALFSTISTCDCNDEIIGLYNSFDDLIAMTNKKLTQIRDCYKNKVPGIIKTGVYKGEIGFLRSKVFMSSFMSSL